jgi:CRP/FNR family transcriptional regulator
MLEVKANLSKTYSRQRMPEIRARRFERERDSPSGIENLLSPEQQLEFHNIATVLEYSRSGTMVFAEGEDAHFVYSVAAGVVRICRHSYDGRRQVLALMLPGDLFGLPDQGVHVNSAEVVCASTLYRVPWLQLLGLIERAPAIHFNLLNRVAYDLREAQRRIMVLGQQNTCQRLASLLLDFIQNPAYFDAESRRLAMPLTRFDIGDYLGMAPETLARALKRLERDRLIRRVTARTIEINNVEGLIDLQRARRRAKSPPEEGARGSRHT